MWETEGFGIAEGWDQANKRYVGLRAGQIGGQYIDGSTLVVKPELARHQLDARVVPTTPAEDGGPSPLPLQFREHAGTADVTPGTSAPPPPMRRFYGSIKLNEMKVSSTAGQVGDEVIKHLTALLGSDVEVTLEIRATVKDGIPDNVIRTVSENANTLKFETFEFEEE